MNIVPKIRPVTDVVVPTTDIAQTADGIPIYGIRQAGSDLIRLDLCFLAGRPQEKNKLSAQVCAAMMNESNTMFSSEVLADKIEFYGASLSVVSSLDTIEIRLVCLKKHFESLAKLVVSVLDKPLFLKSELEKYLRRSKERLKTQLAKNEVIAYRTITEQIFGSDHPYGYNSSESLLDSVLVSHIAEHFEQGMNRSNCLIFLAGDYGTNDFTTIDFISEHIAKPSQNGIGRKSVVKAPLTSKKKVRVKGGELQSSIRLGRPTFDRNHEDYIGLNFLNLIFGGFFGSRLVSNIREEKGLTYGIHSTLDFYRFDGMMTISTEVAPHNVELCLREIELEMLRLQENKVSQEELDLARNYLFGQYLNLFDGAFNSIRAIKSLVLSQIPLDKLQLSVELSKSIDSEQLLSLAQKYFNGNDFWKVIVGP